MNIFFIFLRKTGDKALYFYGGSKELNFFDSKLFDIVEEKIIGKDKKIILRKNKNGFERYQRAYF